MLRSWLLASGLGLLGCSAPAAPGSKPAEPLPPVAVATVDAAPADPPAPSTDGPITVDRAKAAECSKLADAINVDPEGVGYRMYVDAARCFYDANAISAAIQFWNQVEMYYAPEAGRDAVLGLAEAYERADTIKPGYYLADAARAHERFAGKYAKDRAEMVPHLQRALCIRVTLGHADEVRKDTHALADALRQPPIADPAAYCAAR